MAMVPNIAKAANMARVPNIARAIEHGEGVNRAQRRKAVASATVPRNICA